MLFTSDTWAISSETWALFPSEEAWAIVHTSILSRKQNVNTAPDTEGKSVHSSSFRRKSFTQLKLFHKANKCTVQVKVAEEIKCTQLKFQKETVCSSSSFRRKKWIKLKMQKEKRIRSSSSRSKKVCRYRFQATKRKTCIYTERKSFQKSAYSSRFRRKQVHAAQTFLEGTQCI